MCHSNCQISQEVEYVALSRDTSESDLKQRRELNDGSVEYFDTGAASAALRGRVLILEGNTLTITRLLRGILFQIEFKHLGERLPFVCIPICYQMQGGRAQFTQMACIPKASK